MTEESLSEKTFGGLHENIVRTLGRNRITSSRELQNHTLAKLWIICDPGRFQDLWRWMAANQTEAKDHSPQKLELPSSSADARKRWPKLSAGLARLVFVFSLVPEVVASVDEKDLLDIQSLGEKKLSLLREAFNS